MKASTRPAAPKTASPYKGLDHYEEQDAPFFFGRKSESDLVVANVLAGRLTLLYGHSGVGKSSLLHAGVLPRLQETPDLIAVMFRSWSGNPLAGLAAAIGAAAAMEQPAAELSLAETIAMCAQRRGCELVIILDQFEEYFVYHSRDLGARSFAVEFSRAVNQRDLPVSFLISMREDALGWLDDFKGRIPNLFGNYLRMNSLSRKAGQDAITGPIKTYNSVLPEDERVDIEPPVVGAILDQVQVGRVQIGEAGIGVSDDLSAREARIEAPYLQLVLTRLWEEERDIGSRVIRLETLDRLGGAQRIVPTHLDAAMARLSSEERDLASRVFRFLVTPSGTKIAHRPADLAAYAKLDSNLVKRLLNRLSEPQTRILRGDSEGRYEIYHDVLAPAILDWGARRRTRRLRLTIAFRVMLLLLFIGGIFGYQFTAARTGQQLLVGWIIGVSATVGVILLIFGLGVRWGRIHP
jgi:hypothetical protein